MICDWHHYLLSQLFADQDPYDFIDPNPDEEATLSEGDLQHNAPYVSCIKVRINIYTDPYVHAF